MIRRPPRSTRSRDRRQRQMCIRDRAKPYFSNLQIEVMPLKTEEYKELTNHGLNGVICFQETYNKANYKIYHPRGMKSKFEWRVNGFDRMGQAGVHKIGMGVLIGLEEWRTDVTMLAYHLRYLQKHYWKTKYLSLIHISEPTRRN